LLGLLKEPPKPKLPSGNPRPRAIHAYKVGAHFLKIRLSLMREYGYAMPLPNHCLDNTEAVRDVPTDRVVLAEETGVGNSIKDIHRQIGDTQALVAMENRK
jgi:hypothetical protein